MRTDVKIGVVLGLLVVAGIVVYFSLTKTDGTNQSNGQLADKGKDKIQPPPPRFGSPPPQPQQPTDEARTPSGPASGDSDQTPLIGVGPSESDRTRSNPAKTPGSEGGTPSDLTGPSAGATPSDGTGPAGGGTPSEPRTPAEPGGAAKTDPGTLSVGPPASSGTGLRPLFGAGSDATPAKSGAADSAAAKTPPAADSGDAVASKTPEVRTPPADATREPAPPSDVVTVTGPATGADRVDVIPRSSQPLGAGTGSTYEVKPGDRLWNIAEKVYGPGKGSLWTLIAKANPKIDPGNLTVGAKLTIPQAPAPSPRTPGPGLDETAVTGAGNKIHTIQKGEGFWKIAEKYYGNGALWTVIAKANPTLNSNSLRDGTKVIVPPKPELQARTLPGGAVEPVEIRPGYRQYRVKAGDILSKIAQEMYGSQKHWPLIAKANPTANPNNLKLGTVLTIPPLSGGEDIASRPGGTGLIEPAGPGRSADTTPRRRRPAESPVPPGRPDFGP